MLVQPPLGKTWTAFQHEVYDTVFTIPQGKVYTHVARKLQRGDGAAKAVGNALALVGEDCPAVPWWRVVHNVDWPAILLQEGVEIDTDGRVVERCFCEDW